MGNVKEHCTLTFNKVCSDGAVNCTVLSNTDLNVKTAVFTSP